LHEELDRERKQEGQTSGFQRRPVSDHDSISGLKVTSTTGRSMPSQRRFPPPWFIEEYNDACFIVIDASGQKLGYFYFEEEPGRRSAAKLLTKDEARRIAANVAKP
jgi:hypothetical protein